MSGIKKYENIVNIILKAGMFVVICLIATLLIRTSNIYLIACGIGTIVGVILFLFKQLNHKIKEKTSKDIKFGKIFYTICSIIFSIIFIWQFLINTKDLMIEHFIQSQYNCYTTGTILEITDDSVLIDCIINKENVTLEYETETPNDYENITGEIYVYYEKNDIENCTLVAPSFMKILYYLTYSILTLTTFFLAFFSCKNLYRIYKPKKNKKEIKVKHAKT